LDVAPLKPKHRVDINAQTLKTDAPWFRILCLCCDLRVLQYFPPRREHFSLLVMNRMRPAAFGLYGKQGR
jgi:hypothetical protein